MESQWGLAVTGYSPGSSRGRRARRRLAVRGGGLELTVTTTPAEMLSVAVNMAQNGWSFEECLELLGLRGWAALPGAYRRRLHRDGQSGRTDALFDHGAGVRTLPPSHSPRADGL